MTLHLFEPAQYRVMPWKNGGGTTTELSIEPPGASLETGFDWRLSMAAVGTSGPFSRFEGYDRTLLLLEGGGMQLDHGPNGTARLSACLEPIRFSGDWQTAGTLLQGPCRDFNVITRRTTCRHSLEVLRLGPVPYALPVAEVRFLFCASGQAAILPSALRLGPQHLLRIEGMEPDLRVTAETPATTLLSIGINRLEA